jgi:NAD(P)-dependent dehydrogenase (short-subunit alcohol dehydrogenase family)
MKLGTVRSVLITGAAAGFGRELVRAYLERGWLVVATMRRLEERRGSFSEELARHGDRLRLLELDVTSETDRRAASEWVARELGGRLDALVNNAGYGLFGALESCTEAEIRDQFEVNFFGSVLLARALLPALRSAGGCLVQFSSVLGYVGLPLTSLYCASKHAVEGWAEALRHELAPHGVRVLLVEPGSFRTRFADSIRWGSAPAPAFEAARSRYEELKERAVSRQSLTAPGRLARAVVRLSERASPPLRARFGTDARMAHLARSALPGRVWIGAQTRMYRWLLGQG